MSSRVLRPLTRSLETLEDRSTPAVWNVPWTEPGRLTLSFAPDGTGFTDGGTSTLSAALGQRMTAAEWQGEFLRAAQAWSAAANINIGLVADGGQAFGAGGPLQGSTQYGDIRVGARPLPASQLVVTTPFDLLGAGAGDIIVNSAQPFSRGGGNGTYDLYTAALQEVGHALGLPNSPDPASVMYTTYNGVKGGLSGGDVAAVRKLYGARPADRYEGSNGNDTPNRATTLSLSTSGAALSGTTAGGALAVTADLTTAADLDTYKLAVPGGLTQFVAQVRTNGVSTLVGRLTVLDEAGQVVATAAAGDPRTGDLTVTAEGLTAGLTYYVKVEAADPRFAVGGYRLAVGTAADKTQSALYPAAVTGFIGADGGRNDSSGDATELPDVDKDTANRWAWTGRRSVESAQDRDFYRVKLDKLDGGGTLVLTVWATEAGKLDPMLRVYDKNGNPRAFDVVANDRSSYTVQVTGLSNQTELVFEVSNTPLAPADRQTGNYFLAVGLRAESLPLHTVTSRTLTGTAKQWAGQINVTLPRTYRFVLGTGAATDVAARVTVYDPTNVAVASFVVQAGDTLARDVLLGVGRYTVKVSAAHKTGAAFSLPITLRAVLRNDPIGPEGEDTSGSADPGNPAPPVAEPPPLEWAYWSDDYSDPWVGE